MLNIQMFFSPHAIKLFIICSKFVILKKINISYGRQKIRELDASLEIPITHNSSIWLIGYGTFKEEL